MDKKPLDRLKRQKRLMERILPKLGVGKKALRRQLLDDIISLDKEIKLTRSRSITDNASPS